MNSATDQTEVYPENLDEDQDIYSHERKPEVFESTRPSEMPSKSRHAKQAHKDGVEGESIDDSVKEDMQKLEDTFPGVSERFRLINRIGEGKDLCCCHRAPADSAFAGTFSTVYKAEDLLYDYYENDWAQDVDLHDDHWENPPSKKRRLGENSSGPQSNEKKTPRYVALKKIYVTSSPLRIQNELELLHDLRGCRSVCPLITAFRHQDQVVAVLPFFRHTDFRIQYRTFMVADMRHYFRSLFSALASVHKHDILHRDIKPT